MERWRLGGVQRGGPESVSHWALQGAARDTGAIAPRPSCTRSISPAKISASWRRQQKVDTSAESCTGPQLGSAWRQSQLTQLGKLFPFLPCCRRWAPAVRGTRWHGVPRPSLWNPGQDLGTPDAVPGREPPGLAVSSCLGHKSPPGTVKSCPCPLCKGEGSRAKPWGGGKPCCWEWGDSLTPLTFGMHGLGSRE